MNFFDHPIIEIIKFVCFQFSFAIIFSRFKGVGHLDHKNLLYAIKHSGIPCINSLESMWGMMQKPWVYGELLQIQKRVGYEAFPLIGQTYYPTHRDMVLSISFILAKISLRIFPFGKINLDIKFNAQLCIFFEWKKQFPNQAHENIIYDITGHGVFSESL